MSVVIDFQIKPLNQCPQYIEVCAAWNYAQWGCYEPEETYERALAHYKSSVDDQSLPLYWVAYDDVRPMGMIGLRTYEHPDHTDLKPWIGGVFVHPEFRGRGIAVAMMDVALKSARDVFGYKKCYLQSYTPDYYAKFGWINLGNVRDTADVHPDGIYLMEKKL